MQIIELVEKIESYMYDIFFKEGLFFHKNNALYLFLTNEIFILFIIALLSRYFLHLLLGIKNKVQGILHVKRTFENYGLNVSEVMGFSYKRYFTRKSNSCKTNMDREQSFFRPFAPGLFRDQSEQHRGGKRGRPNFRPFGAQTGRSRGEFVRQRLGTAVHRPIGSERAYLSQEESDFSRFTMSYRGSYSRGFASSQNVSEASETTASQPKYRGIVPSQSARLGDQSEFTAPQSHFSGFMPPQSESDIREFAAFQPDFSGFTPSQSAGFGQSPFSGFASQATATSTAAWQTDEDPLERLCRLMEEDSDSYAADDKGEETLPYILPDMPKVRGCNFCKKNGEAKQFYMSHNLKDAYRNVECPVLRRYVCPLCGATEGKAHTIKYCPLNEEKTSTVMSARTPRKSCGCRLQHSCDKLHLN